MLEEKTYEHIITDTVKIDMVTHFSTKHHWACEFWAPFAIVCPAFMSGMKRSSPAAVQTSPSLSVNQRKRHQTRTYWNTLKLFPEEDPVTATLNGTCFEIPIDSAQCDHIKSFPMFLMVKPPQLMPKSSSNPTIFSV